MVLCGEICNNKGFKQLVLATNTSHLHLDNNSLCKTIIGFGEVDDHKQHSILVKYEYHHSRLVNTDWTTSYYYQPIITRSSTDPLYDLDLEIELTLRSLRKTRNIVVSNSSNCDSASSSDNSNSATNSSDSVEYNSTNIFAKSVQMENNDRTLKELATPDVVRRPPQTSERIPCGLFHNEAAGDTKRLHQNAGVPILLGWSSEGLTVSSACSLQHLGRYEAYILGEVLSSIQNHDHQEGNLWDKATIRRNPARVLGKIQQIVCHLSTSSDQ
ncbi:hypothetical protein CR513_36794, partial [Mucuna pruriens]